MLRAFLIFTYIIGVLICSALVRAEPLILPVPVESAQFDSASNALHLSGVLPHSCAQNPTSLIKYDPRTQNVLISVIAEQPFELCIQNLPQAFDLLLDVNQVFAQVHPTIQTGRPVQILVPSAQFSVELFFNEDVVAHPAKPDFFEGQVFELEGRYFLKANHDVLFLKTVLIDVEKYVGQRVKILGHKSEQAVPVIEFSQKGAEFETASPQEVGIDYGQNASATEFILTSISAVL